MMSAITPGKGSGKAACHPAKRNEPRHETCSDRRHPRCRRVDRRPGHGERPGSHHLRRHPERLRELHAPEQLQRDLPHQHRDEEHVLGGGELLRGDRVPEPGQHLRRLLLARERGGPGVDLRPELLDRQGRLGLRAEHRQGQRHAQPLQRLTEPAAAEGPPGRPPAA
ncbi:hypothetical protein SCOCK_90099 [Actinacidiphila cocklensis]|uniref:Uncharacterized protein n=1 Tax=Actinacidiphila cocklensis TaxID=887465 RepID=A0A9W4GW74_9ACTN|nr:hypothetical protein SCOCK_90099 [Actinacidiphila cocklensis]